MLLVRSFNDLVESDISHPIVPWWRHQMETFSALLALCAGNSSVSGEFPAQRPVTRGLAVFFDLRLNKRLSKQSWGWWFETLSSPLWRHCNDSEPVLARPVFKNTYNRHPIIVARGTGMGCVLWVQSQTDYGPTDAEAASCKPIGGQR